MIVWDESKRRQTLARRGLDFADAAKVFAGDHFDRLDDRRDYGEPRYITAGFLKDRFVVVTWTPRGQARRIISMRFGHDKEKKRFTQSVG
ncbi:MAG: BrnT family toxin [Rhodospirillaceae bacterium]|nr:BrnT family toxin [Rhodospirillaceae bacterium]